MVAFSSIGGDSCNEENIPSVSITMIEDKRQLNYMNKVLKLDLLLIEIIIFL